jgi:hypothetical protein
MFPSIGYTGRLAGDPLGMMTQGDNLLKAGLGSQKSDVSCDPFQCAVRWGDYSSMSIDPADDCTFWYANEYYTLAGQQSSTAGWQTRIANFRLPSC